MDINHVRVWDDERNIGIVDKFKDGHTDARDRTLEDKSKESDGK